MKKDILLSTTASIPNYEVIESKGLVFANVVLGTNFFSDFAAHQQFQTIERFVYAIYCFVKCLLHVFCVFPRFDEPGVVAEISGGVFLEQSLILLCLDKIFNTIRTEVAVIEKHEFRLFKLISTDRTLEHTACIGTTLLS